jgi:hypothetical protein
MLVILVMESRRGSGLSVLIRNAHDKAIANTDTSPHTNRSFHPHMDIVSAMFPFLHKKNPPIPKKK